MTNTALDIRARYALALVAHIIHGSDVGEEREAEVYFEAVEMGRDSFRQGDPTLPFLFRDVPFLTRGWKDGFSNGYENWVMSAPSQHVEDVSPQTLFETLQYSRRHKLDLYLLSVDEYGIWVTNPYGVDCALMPMTLEGCVHVLSLIEKTKRRIREWAHI